MSSYTIPTVVESTARGERVSDIYSRLLSERIVFIGTPIDDGVANVVVAQMLHLAAASPHDIQLYVNSPGGSFSAMLAIYDTMQFVGCDVATLCVGQASSTAATLLAAGAKVVAHDPVAIDEARTHHLGDRVEYVDDNYAALDGADALIIHTEWMQYRRPDFARMAEALASPIVYDGRNLYSAAQMRRYGFEYHSIGRPSVDAPDTVSDPSGSSAPPGEPA